MKYLALVLPLLVVSCGGGSSSGDAAAPGDAASPDDVAAASTGSDDVIFDDTFLVDDPPVYESKPLPEGLVWLTNDEDPVFASPEATRGGTFTDYILSFPLTLRVYGPDAATGRFTQVKRGMALSLVDLHPNTIRILPSLATHWAFAEDGKTVFYKLDPRARWSDGVPVVADDYLFQRDFQRSEFTVEPYGANYYSNEITDVSKYDDHTISVTSATAAPGDELIYSTTISPAPRHFHKLDENWVTDYDWRVIPNTGAYQISAIEKGRFIELTRKDDWWADDLKYYRNRYNPTTLRYEVIRDDDVAYEYFLRGELDRYLFDGLPARWYDRTTGEPFQAGYIGKLQHYVDLPQRMRGIWLNRADPVLADDRVRLGLAHAMNFDRVLSTIFRGDYERLNHAYEGYYWGYSNPAIEAREFDLAEADRYLDEAGWLIRDADGIRTKDGSRLSIRISYATDEHTPWLVVLREEAKKAGIELALQLMDPAAWGKQIGEKTHQATYVSISTYLAPGFWSPWHSANADKLQTNNLTNTADPALDALIEEYDAGTNLEDRVRLAHEIQQIVHDTASFVPTFKIPYRREAFWRWLRYPDPPASRIAEEIFDPIAPFEGSGLFWIDEQAKADVLAARSEGRNFEPIDVVDTTFRVD